jgi:hypothetical protein
LIRTLRTHGTGRTKIPFVDQPKPSQYGVRTLSKMLSDLLQEALDGTLWRDFKQEITKGLELRPIVLCQLH